MRPPLEVWMLAWMIWSQILVSVVGVYVVEDPVPLIDSTGHRRDNSEDTTRTLQIEEQPVREDSDNNRRITDEPSERMDNIEGPISGIITLDRQQVHCVELKSKRYISDGFCTSIRPITEVVCAGSCIPRDIVSEWYAEHLKVWGNKKRKEWRCVNDSVRQKKVTLLCDNNSTRTYRIKTVRSCKCKRLLQQHNESERPNENIERRQSSNRNKRNRKNNRQ